MGDYIEPADDSELSTHDRLRMLSQRVDGVIDKIEQIEERLNDQIDKLDRGPLGDKERVDDHEERISNLESLNSGSYDIDILADEVDTLKNGNQGEDEGLRSIVEELCDQIRNAAGEAYDAI